jgi:hypothetical protein
MMDFGNLEQLRSKLREIQSFHLAAMNYYASDDHRGFFHQPRNRTTASLSSTATCASSVVRGGLWGNPNAKWGDATAIVDRLLEGDRTGAGLEPNNPFHLAFITESCLDIVDAEEKRLATNKASASSADQQEDVKLQTLQSRVETRLNSEIIPRLIGHLDSHTEAADSLFETRGAINIKPYPPSAYLTQLVFRVLQRRETWRNQLKDRKLNAAVVKWARGEIERQVVFLVTKSRISDPLQLAYAIALHASAQKGADISPEEQTLVHSALELFFKSQTETGLWPPSQPLFHYPEVGDAHAFEYELLTQLLLTRPLFEDLLEYLGNLERSLDQLSKSVFRLTLRDGATARAWASGHHPQFSGPESWSTACVYDFVYALDRLTAEATRRAAFAEVGVPYQPPQLVLDIDAATFASPRTFLDAQIYVGGGPESLRATMIEYLIKPILKERLTISQGRSFSTTTRMSAMLFGPPGTSKTALAKAIAELLRWPLLSVDPSYLVQDGFERLYFRSNLLFRMLSRLEETVVFLDEFDEMGRSRTESSELLSRFITTSMLPKLAAINAERRVIFLLATNYVSNFDIAFSRDGRFDLMFQVMPPTVDEKLRFWPLLKDLIENRPSKEHAGLKEKLNVLTYLETVELYRRLRGADGDIGRQLDDIWEDCIMRRKEKGSEKTWAEKCIDERKYVRL